MAQIGALVTNNDNFKGYSKIIGLVELKLLRFETLNGIIANGFKLTDVIHKGEYNSNWGDSSTSDLRFGSGVIGYFFVGTNYNSGNIGYAHIRAREEAPYSSSYNYSTGFYIYKTFLWGKF